MVAGAQLGYLAGASRHRVLVAAHAARRVIDRSQPIRNCLHFLELLTVLVEGILGLKPVGRIVKSRRRLAWKAWGFVFSRNLGVGSARLVIADARRDIKYQKQET